MLAHFVHPRAEEAAVKLERIPRHVPTHTREEWASISVPTLVLAGGLDRPEYTNSGEYLERKMPDARVQVIAGGEHNMQETHAAEVSAAIEEFVGRALNR